MVQLFQRQTTATAGTSGGGGGGGCALTANLPLKSAAQRTKIHAKKQMSGAGGPRVTGMTATTTGGGGGGGIGGV